MRIMQNNTAAKLLAEFIGTFALIFIGVLAISAVNIVRAPDGIANLASIGLAHGLTIAVMAASLGAVSGGHFNPAVTIAMLAVGKTSVVDAALYIVAQLGGASAAGFLVAGLFDASAVAGGTPALAPQVSPAAGIVIEAITTFLLVNAIFGSAVDDRAPKNVFPFAIGLTVALDIMATGPLTGAAMNPARTFGPALASGMWAHHFVYWVGPIVGAVAAAFTHQFVFQRKA
jgi:MIP family channel proteins